MLIPSNAMKCINAIKYTNAPDSVSCNPALRTSRLCADKILKTNRHVLVTLEMQVHY